METITYQCPSCGAALEYDSTAGKLSCRYCDSTFTEDEVKRYFAENEHKQLDQADPTLTATQAETEEFTGASALYTCPNCGAGVICGELDASTRCHFCHTPVILSGRLSGEFKPDMIIPFKKTRAAAESAFRSFIKGKILLPRAFRSAALKNITALYVPYWLKSGVVSGEISGEGRRVSSTRRGNTVYTHTKVFAVERAAEMVFIRVPCDGSKRIDDSLMESIEPFNYDELKPFSTQYLSGTAAEKYDVTAQEASERIGQRIREAALDILKNDAGGYSSMTLSHENISYKQQQDIYALMPVWFLNYTYKGKDYAFAMNGQTGAFFGSLPKSGWRSFFLWLAVFAVIEAVIVMFTLLGGQ